MNEFSTANNDHANAVGVLGPEEIASRLGRGKVAYITSQTPYGGGEVWALDEMLHLLEAGCDLLVVPRTASGQAFHPKANGLMERCVSEPLLTLASAGEVIRSAMVEPEMIISSIRWIRAKCVSWGEIVKSIAVVPKAFSLGRSLRNETVQHIHAHSTTPSRYLRRSWLGDSAAGTVSPCTVVLGSKTPKYQWPQLESNIRFWPTPLSSLGPFRA